MFHFIKSIFNNYNNSIHFNLNNISLFQNEKNDIIKIDISSPHLISINNQTINNFEYESEFPNYHPHITLAYLKPNTGKKYLRALNNALNQYKLSNPLNKSNEIIYSSANGYNYIFTNNNY